MAARQTELLARVAGALSALVTAVLLFLVLADGPGLNPLNLVTLLAGGISAALTLKWPNRKELLLASALLLIVAFIPASASVGWLYLPSLVMLLIGLVLPARE